MNRIEKCKPMHFTEMGLLFVIIYPWTVWPTIRRDQMQSYRWVAHSQATYQKINIIREHTLQWMQLHGVPLNVVIELPLVVALHLSGAQRSAEAVVWAEWWYRSWAEWWYSKGWVLLRYHLIFFFRSFHCDSIKVLIDTANCLLFYFGRSLFGKNITFQR